MSYADSVAYLYKLGNEFRGAKLGLDRVSFLAQSMGHPERRFKIIHVAGTNGKGSTCAMLESALRYAGRRTGLYTSPHLVSPTERIQIDGTPVSEQEFSAAFDAVPKIEEASYFEMITLMAFHLFAERKVDWAVVEVGLGGRLDATNIVQPQLTVITPIDYDHESWLGKGIESIAFEKAGIMKPGVPAVIAAQRPEARVVIENRAAEVHAPLLDASAWEVTGVLLSARGSRFKAAGIPLECSLAGEHQIVNAVTAAVALNALTFPEDVLQQGIRRAKWPGRLEVVSDSPLIILDGAHNPAGARALAAYIEKFYSGKRIGILYGAMRDKSVEEIAGLLFPLADELILTAPDQLRALRPQIIAEFYPHPNVRLAPKLPAALALPRSCDVLFITGSLYLVGEARALLVQ